MGSSASGGHVSRKKPTTRSQTPRRRIRSPLPPQKSHESQPSSSGNSARSGSKRRPVAKHVTQSSTTTLRLGTKPASMQRVQTISWPVSGSNPTPSPPQRGQTSRNGLLTHLLSQQETETARTPVRGGWIVGCPCHEGSVMDSHG
jgi:hypothetical protein